MSRKKKQTVTEQLEQRESLTAKLERYLKAHAGEVLQPIDLMLCVGANYRSRIADCRERGMRIDNLEQFKADGSRTYGAYIFVPHEPLGPDASSERPATAEAAERFGGVDAPTLFPMV